MNNIPSTLADIKHDIIELCEKITNDETPPEDEEELQEQLDELLSAYADLVNS